MSELVVAYLNDPDPVYNDSSELDKTLKDLFTKQGLKVIPFELSDISIKIQSTGINFYLNDSKDELQFDAFFAYGYMSRFKETAFNYLNTAMEKANKFILHPTSNLKVMNDKLLQALSYSNFNLNIPKTYTAFAIPSFRNVFDNNFEKQENAIFKNLVDFGGDGVKKCNQRADTICAFSRNIWDNQYSVIQKFIPDSLGRSVRVFMLGGKGIIVAEYVDKSGDFRSNISFTPDLYSMVNVDDTEKRKKYIELSEEAVKSIGDVLVAGVDLVDSKQNGIAVIEINAYPDMSDIDNF